MKKVLSIVLLLAILVVAVAPMTVTASQDPPVKLFAVALAQGGNSGDPPDLTVSPGDIGFTPPEPVVGDTVIITATIHNIGDANARGVLVYFYANSTFIDEDGIKVIPKGQSRSAGINWIPDVTGNYIIFVVVDPGNAIAESNEGNNEASKTVTVLEAAPPPPPPPPPAIEYELFIEIDYMLGHEPTENVLVYIHDYYYERAINVTFIIDDVVEDPTPATGITDDDFWDIEAQYNDHDYGYYSKWKWVLFGTTDAEYNAFGYCWVVAEGRIKLDIIVGNYMFIADETADNWAVKYLGEGKEFGAEAVVLMHEMGHSIGIGEAHRFRGEIYCDNQECVMAKLSTANADNYGAWFYCDYHWAQKNLE